MDLLAQQKNAVIEAYREACRQTEERLARWDGVKKIETPLCFFNNFFARQLRKHPVFTPHTISRLVEQIKDYKNLQVCVGSLYRAHYKGRISDTEQELLEHLLDNQYKSTYIHVRPFSSLFSFSTTF